MSTLAFTEEQRAAGTRPGARTIYRALDLAIAVLGLIACAPLLGLLVVAIRLEGEGPAIFRQRRVGRDKRLFTLHKLRTMRPQADPQVHREYVEQLIRGEEDTQADHDGRCLYKLAADDRITRVGRLLRKSSFDELPQLWDVLVGHMSVVGPRPVIPYEAELYPPDYDLRFAVKPGLTGLWQVNGRNERTYLEMVELDLAWVSRRTVRLYLSIVLRTPWVLLRRRGAA